MDHDRAIRVLSGEARDISAKLLRLGTGFAEPPYATAMRLRNRAFDFGIKKTHDLGRPTISVGNLTTGGTGKTPMVVELCERLQKLGQTPGVLLRGYQAEQEASSSDEATLLRKSLPALAVVANPDRVAGAETMLEQHPDTDVLVLDDAFQHRQAGRDLDLVLIDATRPWGFGHVLPRGLLREPMSSLRRADAVIITRSDRVTAEQLQQLDREIEHWHGQPPVGYARHAWVGLMCNQDVLPLDTLQDLDVLGVSGIGNPADFEASLEDTASSVVTFRRFDDHHPYTAADLDALLQKARSHKADAVVTTEKDFVKWQALNDDWPSDLPIYRPRLGMAIAESENGLTKLLSSFRS
jgi:tetraacyldisaccharide 4'-kinase